MSRSCRHDPWPVIRAAAMAQPARPVYHCELDRAGPGPDRFLAELGGRLLADGLPLAGAP